MDTREHGDPTDIIARQLMAGARAMGRFFATSAKPEAVAGALVLLELLVPMLIDCDQHGLTPKHMHDLIVCIARGIRHAEETD